MRNKFFITLFIFSLAVLYSCQEQETKVAKQMPPSAYTITLKEYPNQPAPTLQSFAFATYGDYWLALGGRTVGFHETENTDPNATFPAKYNNKRIWVINKDSSKTWSVALPSQYMDFLSSTNTQHYQEGNILYVCGGYGQNSDGDYVTYSNLAAIKVNELVNAILSSDTSNVAQYLTVIENDKMKVTGGELLKMGGYYYLAVGQDFEGIYTAAKTGAYTNEVRKFTISFDGTTLTADFIEAYSDGLPNETTQYHRRDLNVLPVIRWDKSPGITIFGGVFTQIYNGPFLWPIKIYETKSGTVTEVDSSFKQTMCQYSCANISMYDDVLNNMYSTFLGGISYYAYDVTDSLKPDPGMPFIKSVYTIRRDNKGNYSEYVQPNDQSLPGYLGAEAKFIPQHDLIMEGTDEIIDFNKLPKSGGLIGYFYGGILSQKAQSSMLYPTVASGTIYEVHLSWN